MYKVWELISVFQKRVLHPKFVKKTDLDTEISGIPNFPAGINTEINIFLVAKPRGIRLKIKEEDVFIRVVFFFLIMLFLIKKEIQLAHDQWNVHFELIISDVIRLC